MKTSVVVGIVSSVAVIIGLLTLVIVTGHDPSLYLVAVTTIVPTIAVLFGINSLNKSTDTIKSNTNGTLSDMRAELAASTEQLKQALALLPPDSAHQITSAPATAPVVAQNHDPVL